MSKEVSPIPPSDDELAPAEGHASSDALSGAFWNVFAAGENAPLPAAETLAPPVFESPIASPAIDAPSFDAPLIDEPFLVSPAPPPAMALESGGLDDAMRAAMMSLEDPILPDAPERPAPPMSAGIPSPALEATLASTPIAALALTSAAPTPAADKKPNTNSIQAKVVEPQRVARSPEAEEADRVDPSTAWARFEACEDDGERRRMATRMATAARDRAFDLDAQVYASRMFLELKRPLAAIRFLEAAVSLAPDRSDLQTMLRLANEGASATRGDATLSGGSDDLLSEGAVDVGRDALRARSKDRRAFTASLGVYFLVLLFFGAAATLPLARGEMDFTGKNPLFWVRMLVLSLFGWPAMRLLLGHRPLRTASLSLDPRPVLSMAPFAAILAVSMPFAFVKSPLPVAIALGLVQVASEEAFFRLFLGRATGRVLTGVVLPVLVGAIQFTLYRLSFPDVWYHLTARDSALLFVGTQLGAGAFFAGLQRRTGTVALPIVARILVQTIYLISSVR